MSKYIPKQELTETTKFVFYVSDVSGILTEDEDLQDSENLQLICIDGTYEMQMMDLDNPQECLQDITESIDIQLIDVECSDQSDLQLPNLNISSLETLNSGHHDKTQKNDKEEEVFISQSGSSVKDSNLEPSISEINNISVTDGAQSQSCIENEAFNSSAEVEGKKTRRKRGRASKEEWDQEKNKTKRLKGEEYCGRRKNAEGKIVFDVKKGKRELKQRCLCTDKNKKSFKCSTVTDEKRKTLFEMFWRLNWGERKIFVNSLVDKKPVAQRKECNTDNRRNNSLTYHIKLNEDRVKVCKTMFLSTFCIGEWTVLNWVTSDEASGTSTQVIDDGEQNGEVTTKRQSRKRKQAQEKLKRDLIKEFLDSLPKLESHYCRKDTKKLYLESKWQSKADLYRLYESYCDSKGKEGLKSSVCTFYNIFEEMNLSLFQPKKDQCDVCVAFSAKNLSEEEYNNHIKKKEEARKEKEIDKTKTDVKTAVFTMDLEAVLLSPNLNASALYYRTKLKVHNFTIYNIKTHDAYCYLWDESEGGLNADEFASILTNFITKEIDTTNYTHLIFYSDGCTYQNRNSILSNALLFASKQTGLTITQKFLEKGHTQMECDSVHSRVENRLKNREIYSPAGYLEACRTARINPVPYFVKYLYHDFFKKYSDLKFVSSIRPGVKKGDPVVTDIKCILYDPVGSLKIKLNFSDGYSDLPRPVRNPSTDMAIEPLYKSRLPIEVTKFKHLQEMKVVLPRDVHPYYDNLPHYSSKNSRKICEGGTCSCIISVSFSN